MGSIVWSPSSAQVTSGNFSNVKVDELSDEQIRSFMRQFEATGLPESQLEQAALAKGISPSEIQKLKQRVAALKSQTSNGGKDNGTTPVSSSRESSAPVNNAAVASETGSALATLKSKIFGAELFQNPNMSFEPNLRIATPQNYVIGPDDVIQIDITGDNEASYKLPVSPEGSIRVEYAGIIPLSGLTIEQATARIRTRLQGTYPAMRSGRTRLTVSLGNIRSIKVSLLGEVMRPGTYTISSLSTVFNALYASGGPNNNGSFRQIEVIRNNRVITRIDVYDYLLKGYQTNNIRLQDQDVIRIPTYNVHAELSGEVKHPAIFEVLPGETLQDVLGFAGGFTDQAYTARIKVLQNTPTERRITDIYAADYKSYTPQNGDKFFVDVILDRFANRVSIQGAVFRPGQFELQPGLTLSQLIKKADGVTEDAFLPRGYITRLQPDNTTELISFDLGKILAGTSPDIPLLREDIVTVSSIFDLREEYSVSIDGEIRQPGTFAYAENMSLEDLLILAGGFKEGASPKRIEIARRVKNSDITSASAKTAEVFQVNVDANLRLLGEKFILQPFDIVTVRNETGYEVQRRIRVEGEVLYPGEYTITSKDERVSDLVQRAGGLTALAFPSGASLKRPGVQVTADKNKIDKADEEKEKLIKFQRLQSTAKDSVDIAQQQVILQNTYVGINLEKILEKPGSKADLILEEGDILRVPKQLQTVKVTGEVLFPVTTIYNQGKGFKQYISEAGGFSDKSLKRRAYVLYANGSVRSTKKFLFFNNYPVIKPGAEVFVPQRGERNKLTAQELVGIVSGVVSTGALVLGILNLSK
ncbi:MAG: capsule biosynthesis protein [Sphingobacteriaceae bacterium]|nr:capsule biosynthesis protein [Sphingobacteriaceae bacterium]